MTPGAPTTVSVVIPCRDEEAFIGRCLDSVLGWDASGLQIEVLVVDGASTDRTASIVSELAARDGRVRLIANPRRIKPTALNIGIRAARGEWLVRLDAHSEYPPDYLQQCLATAQRTGADNVGGVVVPRLRSDRLSAQLVQALTTHRFGVGSDFRVTSREGEADTVPFGCYRRDVFDRVGGFDERLVHSQDFEFNQRLLRAGGRVWLNPGIRVFYYNEATLRGFFRKVWVRDGPWNPWMWYVAPYSFRVRHAVPMAFVLGIVSLGALGAFVPAAVPALAAVMGLYAALAVLAATQQALRYRRWWLAFMLPPLFLSYHLLHGLGGLWGAVRLALGMAPVQRLDSAPAEARSS